jgi:poly-beta-1,6-N-acetyl-D-glucosamine synthase
MMVPLLLILLAFGLAVSFAMVINSWRETVARELITSAEAARKGSPWPTVALIVPARDAADTITPLLQDLYAQNYDRASVSVIVVDDESSDTTAERVRGMMVRWPGLRLLANDGAGKKAAITTAVLATDADWILMTDADARCGPERLWLVMEHAIRTASDLVILPVATDGTGVLGRLQANEQAALMMCAAGEALQGRPMLANGANLAFRRTAFMEVRGFEGDRYASGDDVFLVQRMRAAGKRISYFLHPGAVVRVEAERTWTGFFRQRMRWAGKMNGVPWGVKWMPALGLLFPWLLMALSWAIDWPALVGSRFLMAALLLIGAWLIWAAVVPPLVRDGNHVLGQRNSMVSACLSYLAFVIYAPMIALVVMYRRPQWKGRPS